MPLYVLRVELRDSPTRVEYDNLHLVMRAKGFVQTIVDDAGVSLQLPHATYSTMTYSSASDAARAAHAAATRVWRDLVVLASGSEWAAMGLTIVRSALL